MQISVSIRGDAAFFYVFAWLLWYSQLQLNRMLPTICYISAAPLFWRMKEGRASSVPSPPFFWDSCLFLQHFIIGLTYRQVQAFWEIELEMPGGGGGNGIMGAPEKISLVAGTLHRSMDCVSTEVQSSPVNTIIASRTERQGIVTCFIGSPH